MKTVCAWDNVHCIMQHPPDITAGVLIAVFIAALGAYIFANNT